MQSSDEKFRKALETCLERELAFIPDDKEIKKIYTPSEKFKIEMKKMIHLENHPNSYQLIKKHKKKIYYFVAVAAILILGIRLGFVPLSSEEKADEMAMPPQSESYSESADIASTESVPQDTLFDTGSEEKSATTQIESDMAWGFSESSNTEIALILRNNTESSLEYTDITKIERREGNNFITIYTNNQAKQYTLEPQEHIGESILRADYNMNESGTYRLYRTIQEDEINIEIEIP